MKHLVIAVSFLLAPSLALADKDFEDGTGATWNCGDDPVVNINHGAGTYHFVGACTTINVNGGSNHITIANTDELNINGGNNTVSVDQVGTINVTGARNKVTWKRATDGDAPGVAVVGKGNRVGKAK